MRRASPAVLASARPGLTLAVAFAAVLAAVALASGLRPDASSDLLASRDSDVGRANAALRKDFGADPIYVTVDGDLGRTLALRNLVPLTGLEGKLARLPGVKAVYGPGTFINQTVVQADRVIGAELGAAARSGRRGLRRTARQYADLLVRFGFAGAPSMANRAFVAALVFGAGAEPKRRFRWLFPDRNHAVVIVRPEPGVGGERMLDLGARIERLARRTDLAGVRVAVAGSPLVAAALEREVRRELLVLTPLAALAMLALLLVVRRRAQGVAALVAAGAATVVTVGLSAVLGLGLTPATVAALPIVLGLSLDYAVQLQARYWTARAAREAPRAAVAGAAAAVWPPLALSGALTALGFLVLRLGGAPLLDRLGATLALGVAAGLASAFTVCPALLVRFDRGPARPLAAPLPRRLRAFRLRAPVIALLAVAACAGLAVSARTPVESDVTRLAPAGMAQLRAVEDLQRSLGTSDRLSVAVRARDVTQPRVLRFLAELQQRVLALDPRLRPGPNLAEVLTYGTTSQQLTTARVRRMLRLLPPYFLESVVNRDRTLAELSFGLPLVSVQQQARLVDRVRGLLHGAPPGVHAAPAGLVASASESERALERMRPGLLLLAAALMAAILLARWSDPVRVLVVLSPALLATGLLALALWALRVRLSPLAAGLEPLALAIGVEFSLLLEARYREARVAGAAPAGARRLAVDGIGGAVALSAGTVAAGFAALGLSAMPALRQLGWLVALELAVCAVVALAVVPAAAELLDGRRLPAWRGRVGLLGARR